MLLRSPNLNNQSDDFEMETSFFLYLTHKCTKFNKEKLALVYLAYLATLDRISFPVYTKYMGRAAPPKYYAQ